MFDFDVREIGDRRDAGDAGRMGQLLALSTIRLDVSVTEIPRGPALALSPEAGVASAMAAMRRRGCGAAIVVQNHRPIGVVTDRDILQVCGDTSDLRVIPIGTVMTRCDEPLRDGDTVAQALRAMCSRRQWTMPIVCSRGLFLGALDIADISMWLRDRMTMISVNAAFAGADASI